VIESQSRGQGRILQFHAAVDERFAFLLTEGFRPADRGSYSDRFGRVEFRSDAVKLYLSWDAYDGCLEAKLHGTNLWPFVTAEGLWDSGRYFPVYAGAAVESMQHGLDRIVTLLRAHPEMLQAPSET
jgi:hypothetical protein